MMKWSVNCVNECGTSPPDQTVSGEAFAGILPAIPEEGKQAFIQSITWCKRIAKLVFGFDLVKNAMQMGTAHLILLASDLSQKTEKEVRYLAEQMDYQPLGTPVTMDEYWYLIGKRVGVIAVLDPAFAAKIERMGSSPENAP